MIRRTLTPSLRSVLGLGAVLTLLGCGAVPRSADPVGAPAPVRLDLTPQEVDRQWAEAERHFRRGKWLDAITALERVALEMTPGDPRMARARFYLAESHFATKSHLQAVREFRRVSDDMPGDPLASDALLRAGDAFAALWRRPELDPTYAQTAISTYQEVQSRFAGTPAARLAAVRIAALQDALAQKQYGAAEFYIRYKAYDSAILYLKELASTYPRAKIVPTALLRLIGVYQQLGYSEDVRETCVYLQRFHSSAPGVAAACAAPAAPPAGNG
jgi:outer membrane protein assembly factor BamD